MKGTREMIDIKQKRKTIEIADISPQEEWWEKNLLEAYEEIATLRQQRDKLLAAAEEGLHECERAKMHCTCEWKDIASLLLRIERIKAAIKKAQT